jgi:K+ transporter
VVLFVIQRKGTSWIGGIFGPIMLIWFVVIGILGIVGIAKAPAILAALSPLPAITYLWRKAIFAFMHHNAQRPGAYFNIPSAQVMEIGIDWSTRLVTPRSIPCD